MKLIIMRHGEAGLHSIDERRTLTARGKVQSERVATEIKGAGFRPRLIWHSSYQRAVETARVLAATFEVPPQAQPGLTPESDPMAVITRLQYLPEEESLILVSHMPLVDLLSGLLLRGIPGGHPFETAEAMLVEMDYPSAGCGTFVRQFLGRQESAR